MTKNLNTILPTTPSGDILDEKYWRGIEQDVNRCGERMLDIYRDYKHDSLLNKDKVEKCANEIGSLMKRYNEVVFAVVITIFGENMEGIKISSAFDEAVLSYYDTRTEEMVLTVERLRYINTKFVERKNALLNQLRGEGIAFKNIGKK